jgi:hypothetical protein
MSRTFSNILKCGCMIAENDTDGWEGLMPCYADYKEPKTKAEKKALALHNKCCKEYHEKINNLKQKKL